MITHIVRRFFVLGALAFVANACAVPAHLQKYVQENNASSSRPHPADQQMPNDPASDLPALEAGAGPAPRAANGLPPGMGIPPRATIYAVDTQTFHLSLREEDVWDSLLNVLMRNYNLTVVDRNSGIVTTEWDTFYLNQIVYRNKVSVRVRKLTRNQVEMIVHNNVEKLQDGSTQGTVGAIWLPAGDSQKEVGRIIQNVAILLNQPPPTLLPGMLATDAEAPSKGDIR